MCAEALVNVEGLIFPREVRDDPGTPPVMTGMPERAKTGAQLDLWSEAGAGSESGLTAPARVAYQKAPGDGLRFFRNDA